MSADLAARVALVSLPGIGPARAHWLLAGGSAEEVIGHLRDGRLPCTLGPAPGGVTVKLVQRWSATLRTIVPAELLAEARHVADHILEPGHRYWPYLDDPEPPAVLFGRGNPALLVADAMVAVVGTRRCSAIGRQVGFELGAELSHAGLVVVSGLASGIDGAVHRGVLSAQGRPLAVVGTGLDVVYPATNRDLWARVGAEGLLVSEALPGTRPERWRFPARNRLIAGLVKAVVIVESHYQGGSMYTVNEALDRGRLVLAVPGSVTNPASEGTNQLLVDGCPPVCSARDVLDALGISPSSDTERQRPSDALALSTLGQRIVDHVAAGAVHLDDLISQSNATIPELLAEVNVLTEQGAVQLDGSTVCRAR